MTADDDPVWISVRSDFETSRLTLPQLCEKHGISPAELKTHRKHHNWGNRPVRGTSAPAQRKAARQKVRAEKVRAQKAIPPDGPPRNYEEMLNWAWDHLGRQLNRTEQHFADRHDADTPTTAADRERDARTLASITRTLEKLAELRTIFETYEQEAQRRRDTRASVDYRAVLERRLTHLLASADSGGLSQGVDAGGSALAAE